MASLRGVREGRGGRGREWSITEQDLQRPLVISLSI
jgi:hypothetical protein